MAEPFSIVIPTYNERESITPLLERLAQALQGQRYEVLFIDDNSRDGTGELIRSLSDKYPARVIVRTDKRGLASAVVDGFAAAKYNTVVVMDADLQHPPAVVPKLVAAMEGGADVAIASRYVPGGGAEGWSKTRLIISKGAILLAHLLLPQSRGVKDPMAGFFAVRRDEVLRLKLNPLGYKILLEILGMGRFQKVVEVPYMFHIRERGASKLSTKVGTAYLTHILSLMRRNGELARFIKFLLVGGSGIIVNTGILWLMTSVVGLSKSYALIIAIEVSIITNFLLNNYFTFADRCTPGAAAFFGRFLRFNFFSLPGGVLNWVTTIVLTNLISDNYLLAINLIGILIATLWNFFANNWWTWKR